MHGQEDTQLLTEEEQRVWYTARELDKQMDKADSIYEDAAIQAYVQGVMQKLYPEYAGAINVRVVDSPSLNAFALPNGSIYISTGLMARLDNEAQMATVLAHEGVHFTHKHGLQQRRNIKSSTAFFTAFGMVAGIPMLGELLGASSIYGFSKDLEREADAEGFQRLQAAGYDVTQAPVTFEFLLAEVEALDIDEPYFFSTHPGLQERIDSFKELVKQAGTEGGYRGVEAYQAHIGSLRVRLLADYLELGQYQSVLLILTAKDAFARYPPSAWFYLGEAYRLRDNKGDTDLALKAYQTAAAQVPTFAPPYKALGLHFMKAGQTEQAVSYFNRYLELAPEAPDRAYIEMYRSRMTPQGIN
jgi:predicted Zn-dependent protease